MGFMQQVTEVTNRQLSRLRALRDARIAEAEDRARKRREAARTTAQRLIAKEKLEQEKLKIDKEYYEAKLATQKARDAVKKARKEAGDLSIGERLEYTVRGFMKPKRKTAMRKRKAVVRKPVSRKPAPKKRSLTVRRSA